MQYAELEKSFAKASLLKECTAGQQLLIEMLCNNLIIEKDKTMIETLNSNLVIQTCDLCKKYKKLKAVDHVSLTVQKGEIYGFLGLNGAGKTTTIRMLLGMIRPTFGEAFIFGKKIVPGVKNVWDKIGYLVELPSSYPELTVAENLTATNKLRNNIKGFTLEEILSLLHLTSYRNCKAGKLSLGNHQRLGLAKALMHKPQILILDEPSNGLDPAGIVEIRELLKSLATHQGITIFISSHNLSEISKIADRIGIIHNGKLIREIDTPTLNSCLKRTLLIACNDKDGLFNYVQDKGFEAEKTETGKIRINNWEAAKDPAVINRLFFQAGFTLSHLSADQEDLESYFLRTIGE